MKAFRHILTALVVLMFTQNPNAQTYVNQAATGNNDGSSWADAYTELADALDNYSPGDEIWVAAGTYLPGQPSGWTGDPRNTFYIYQDVAIYGGFDGTETMRSGRDPAANVTILSGDLNGDDLPDDFETNREDNALNVMLVDTLITAATVIDGFTFQGGHADIDDDYFPNKRGGAIFTWGAIQVSNCIFQQNYTIWHGGGIYFWEEGASGGRVENCVFRNNKCLASGAGIFVSQIRGDELVVENCHFDNNEADIAGGGIHFLNSFASANNCQFTNNRATRIGGGIRLVFTEAGIGNQSMSVTNSDFQGNSAGLTGGAIEYGSFSNSSGNSVAIRNCEVTENSSANGGGLWYFSRGTSDGSLTIEACNFINNEALATSADPRPDAAGIGFEYATATPSQNDTVRVVNCLIQDNSTAGITGGLFYIHNAGLDNHLQVDNCEFIGNSEGSGLSVGGMAVAEGGENISVMVHNSLFDGNTGPFGQGFGVGAFDGIDSPAERHIELVNCLFTNHNNSDPGTAVVITSRAFMLTNCTFSENQSALLGTIGDGKITIRNNILQSDGSVTHTTIGDDVGNILPIRSLGGNLVSDDAMDTWLTTADQSGTEPLFETGTFQPAANSPAVDAGVLLGTLTATDFAGNDRIQGGCIDIGAIESPHDAGTACQLGPRRYVDQDATGKNDGSSWADAFTSLHDALENYGLNDEIWVAAGTYLPGPPSAWTGDPRNTFYLHQDVAIYGGFDGTETMRSERDPTTNVTILSGDLNGDDLPDDFETNREDNVINVMFLTEDISPATVIDGFTIASGHADGDDSVPYNQRGGGIWSLGSPLIHQCYFEQNYALASGGGLYLREEASDEAVVTNCVFDGNRSEGNGGGLIITTFGAPGIVQVNNCEFRENIADLNGGGISSSLSSVEVNNSRFVQNTAQRVAGGMYVLNYVGSDYQISVNECDFTENSASRGGAFWMGNASEGNSNITFTSCNFIRNLAIPTAIAASPDGGAVGFWYYSNNPQKDSIIFSDCNFQENLSESAGGGIIFINNHGSDNYFEVSDCAFSNNSTALTGGGIYFVQNDDLDIPTGTRLNIADNDFNDNTAANGGAVAFVGNVGENSEYLITDCNFDGNEANAIPNYDTPVGGAILVQFSGEGFQNNNFLIEDCDLENNTAEFGGGGLFYYGPFGSDNLFEMNDCVVSGNSSPTGGGVATAEGGVDNTVLVLNTFFNQNESVASMAAAVGLNLINPDIPAAVNPYTEFINCLFSNHDDDLGSAVVVEVFGNGVEGTLTNCTFAGNDGTTLGTDVSFPGGQINLRNNILSNGGNPGYVSGTQGNTGTVKSLGGNLVTDATLDAFLDGTDQSSTDPLFEPGLIQLSANSPAVDAGVLLDDPVATDLYGNARIQGGCIDIGAAESPYDAGTACLTTDTGEVLANPSTIFIFPNPVSATASISIEDVGHLNLRIVNALGQTVYTTDFEKSDQSAVLEFDARDLPEGMYRVLVSNGVTMAVSSFVKI